MKKKIGDLTLRELNEICKANHPNCEKDGKNCPLYEAKINCLETQHYHLEDLEEEIEVDDNE